MSRFRETSLFIVKWVVIGLAMAFVLLMMRPQFLRTRPAESTVTQPVVAPLTSFADAVARTAPAVVNVYSRRLVTEPVKPQTYNERNLDAASPALQQGVQTGLGSGVIVDKNGYIVTNNHVIACAQRISVQLADGRTEAATVVGTDPATDIAILKISLTNVPFAPMGTSDSLRTGDIVLAIGNPYGLSQTVTQGIVSATGRGQLGVSPLESFIQTDAAINLGNSGGALINARGELIGINTAALSQTEGVTGISFAVPVNLVRGVMQQILEFGHVKRGWFGVETRELTLQQAAALGLESPQGLIITKVYDDSPAAHAGLRRGDVITRLNGVHRSADEALRLIAGTPPGHNISLNVLHNGQRRDYDITLVERNPKVDAENNCSGTIGGPS
ncbi:MAG TPA: trypsin-like peptidase domain-containing protein [Steroidobacteraceae bacterium]|nr:trypsin-like peptidase domain-containing protein [Steroidobacteraceae bacterium]